jgi:TonB family protein
VFEKVAAPQTVRPPWLRLRGVSASAAAHAAVVLGIASIPPPAEPPLRTTEVATFLVLQQAARAPDTLSRLLAGTAGGGLAASAAPREPAPRPRGEGGEARPRIEDLRLASAAEAAAGPGVAPVPVPVTYGAADLRTLSATADKLSRGLRGKTLLASAVAPDAGVFPAEALAEAPRMVNRPEITRLLVHLYPRRLRDTGIQGDVTLTFIIGVDGRVEMRSVRVLAAAHPDLAGPTFHALARMRFRPARVDGKAVRVRATLPVRWVLHDRLAQAR